MKGQSKQALFVPLVVNFLADIKESLFIGSTRVVWKNKNDSRLLYDENSVCVVGRVLKVNRPFKRKLRECNGCFVTGRVRNGFLRGVGAESEKKEDQKKW